MTSINKIINRDHFAIQMGHLVEHELRAKLEKEDDLLTNYLEQGMVIVTKEFSHIIDRIIEADKGGGKDD